MTEATITASNRLLSSVPEFCDEYTPSGYYPPMGSLWSDATGNVIYWDPGLGADWKPHPYFPGRWHFPWLNLADGSVPAGFVDGASADVSNVTRCLVVGPGTMTVYHRDPGVGNPPGTPTLRIMLLYPNPPGSDVIMENWYLGTDIVTDFEIVVPAVGGSRGPCYHWVDCIYGGNGVIGFGGFDWVSGKDDQEPIVYLRGHAVVAR
jgi:hypothetical protein